MAFDVGERERAVQSDHAPVRLGLLVAGNRSEMAIGSKAKAKGCDRGGFWGDSALRGALVSVAFQRVDSSRGGSSRASRRSRGVSTGQLRPARDSPLTWSARDPQKKTENLKHSAQENPPRVAAKVESDAF